MKQMYNNNKELIMAIYFAISFLGTFLTISNENSFWWFLVAILNMANVVRLVTNKK